MRFVFVAVGGDEGHGLFGEVAAVGGDPLDVLLDEDRAGTLTAGIGVPMSTIKDAFGHSSIKVTERYVNTPREGLRWAMDQVDASVFGTPANEGKPVRTETETTFGLLTFDQVMGARSREGIWSRLGDLNPGPTHYECVALPLS